MFVLLLWTLYSTVVLCDIRPITLHVSRISGGRYTCEELVISILQEHSSTGLSLAFLSEFFSYLRNSVEHDADKKAANALEHLNPFQDTSQVKFDDWKALFYGCRFKENKDTVLQRIYRLGFIRCARTMMHTGVYDASHYIHSRTLDGDNLMHLAVRSGNPELVIILAESLHENVMFLLKGNLALNHDKMTPKDLAQSLNFFGPLDAIKSITFAYNAYKLETPPPLPEKIHFPVIQLIHTPSAIQNFSSKYNESTLNPYTQIDISSVSF